MLECVYVVVKISITLNRVSRLWLPHIHTCVYAYMCISHCSCTLSLLIIDRLFTHTESRSGLASVDPKSTKVWQPLSGVTQEDDNVIDGFLELACSPAVLHAGRNKELATHLLHQVGGSIKASLT